MTTARLRKELAKVLQNQWNAAYKAGQNGKMLAQLITEPIIEDTVLNKLEAIFASHQNFLVHRFVEELNHKKLMKAGFNDNGIIFSYNEILQIITKIRGEL